MRVETIRRKLVALGVPAGRAVSAAQKYGDESGIPTPSNAIEKALKSEARRKKANLERKKFKLWCRANDLPAPIPEHVFHPTRKWRMDWAFEAEKVAVEIHGAVHANGRHTRGTGFLEDRRKMAAAQALGWRVLEVATHELYTDATLTTLRTLLTVKPQEAA